MKDIISKILKPAGFISIGIIFEFSAGIVTLAFMGLNGNAFETGAVGLGMAFTNTLSLCTSYGMSSAVDTLSSQAFGKSNFERCK